MNVDWVHLGMLVGVLSPLVGVPLVMVTFYLRAIRDHQTNLMRELSHRIETLESVMRDHIQRSAEFDRDFTTKEEWVRESMVSRQRLEHLTELVTRIQAELETGRSVAGEISRATAAMVELVKQLSAAA